MAIKHDALAKWMQQTDGQQMAIVTKLYAAGGKNPEVFEMILRGELRIELVDATIKLIDQNGRCIPPANFGFEVVDANRSFHYVQPELNLRDIYNAYRAVIPRELEIVSYEYFEVETQAIMAEIEANRQVASLIKGLHLPVILPKHGFGDYGTALESVYLKMVATAYKQAFPNREFCNYRQGTLAGQVSIVAGTRHDRLISAMRERSVVGVYTLPFQGFSIPADREMIKAFPENWLLSGAIDSAMAFAAFPSVLARDFNTPVADCAAVSWQGPEFSLYLYPSDGRLVFDRGRLGAGDFYSGGVLVLRQG